MDRDGGDSFEVVINREVAHVDGKGAELKNSI